MKRFKLLTILFIGIIILTGCSKTKKAATAQEFYDVADKNGIVVQDVSQLYGLADKAYQSSPNDNQYKLLFIQGKSMSDMQNMFLDEASNVYNKTGLSEEKETQEVGTLTTKAPKKFIASGKNWQSVEVSTDDYYYYIAYVDNTLIYIESTTSNKEKLIKIKDTIKY
jgi:PBP1b-binding outer membrane lipoprotein LpoB